MNLKQLINTIFDTIQESNVLQGIGWLIGIGGFIYGLIQTFRKKLKLKWSNFDQTVFNPEINNNQNLFIPNNIKLNAATGNQEIILKDINEFIDKYILSGTEKFLFLEAGTGVGKTTYLVNLFIKYKRKFNFIQRVFHSKPRILLLNYNNLCRELSLHNNPFSLIGKYSHVSSNTILLIDALDEFQLMSNDPTQKTDFSKYYAQKFIEMWFLVKANLDGFQKVILTVRSQFLTSEIKNALNFGLHFELMLFDKDQAYEYINKKRKLLSVAKGDYLHFIWSKLDNMDLYEDSENVEIKLSRLPLILSYLELLVYEQDAIDLLAKDKSLNLYSLIELVVKNWISREIEDESKKAGRNYGVLEKQSLNKFCQLLAYEIAVKHPSLLTISLEEYEILLNYKKVSTLKFDDRSLIIKNEQNLFGNGKNQIIETRYSYRFVHKIFFEYFIAGYFIEMENDKIQDIQNQLINHNFALDFIIYKRLNEFKSKIPNVKRLFEDKVGIPMRDNALNIEGLEKWNKFFQEILDGKYSIYPFFHRLLPSIEKIDNREFLKSFSSVSNISIQNNLVSTIVVCNNFWDDGKNKPYDIYFNMSPIIAGKVSWFTLENISKLIELEHLKALQLMDDLLLLRIENCNLTGECLKFLEKSYNSLYFLNLSNNNIKNDNDFFKVFEKFNNLSRISLGNNKISGEGLKYFSNCSNTLKALSLKGNSITQDSLKYLSNFKVLETLVIDHNVLPENHKIYKELIERGVEIRY